MSSKSRYRAPTRSSSCLTDIPTGDPKGNRHARREAKATGLVPTMPKATMTPERSWKMKGALRKLFGRLQGRNQ